MAMPSYRRLQQFAIAISIISVLYNGAEGVVSIVFGAESSSRSLIFFGIQSAIEVISALLVLWRFRNISKPGEERNAILKPEELKFEKIATMGIGFLLVALALATEASSIAILALHQEPDSSNASLIISASALVLMIFIWLPKRYLAKALDSSTMQGEAICSLSCIQLTIVLFIGSLIFRVWQAGWWVDGATCIVLGGLFAWEGVKMWRWARSSEFTGGCCADCRVPAPVVVQAEMGEVYRDICECCSQKEECKNSNECQCSSDGKKAENGAENCCSQIRPNSEKCCSREIIQSPRTQVQAGPSAPSSSAQAPTTLPSSCCGDCVKNDVRKDA